MTDARMVVQTATIDFAEVGQPGWLATVRTNPRSSTYDDLLSLKDDGKWWAAFGKIVEHWNFEDEDGRPFPQPSEVESEAELDLPILVMTYLFKRIIEEVKAAAGVPKVPDDESSTTSPINDEALVAA